MAAGEILFAETPLVSGPCKATIPLTRFPILKQTHSASQYFWGAMSHSIVDKIYQILSQGVEVCNQSWRLKQSVSSTKAKPSDDKHTCLVCLRQEQRRGKELPMKCGGCAFPVCSEACGERHSATAECAVIARHVPVDDRGIVNLDAIMPLRSDTLGQKT